ncbi:MAG: DUF1800 domain-containing protein, partial [Burkholderiales bacterium]|nr:DUF1800 domain-containing protein [Anaerolineae bacterium]
MPLSRRNFLQVSAATTIATATATSTNLTWAAPSQQQALAADNPALHLLNRLTWGARLEDVERINAIGIEAYLDEQLNPESLDDSALDEWLDAFPLLNLSRRELYLLEDGGCGGRCGRALINSMVLRAVHSQRQLHERMVEFWSDHFNIPSESETGEVTVFQREVIQRNALGSFRDLLLASAQSPAMLYYLDNFLNEAEHPNENYARELMELHALGVDGGYTEHDVREVSRAFTGWTVHNSSDDGFFFDITVHDTGEKSILGHTLPIERGIEDGLHVLSILANHPSAARFISYKLAVRFVSDDPPQSLIDGMAQ